MMKPPKYRNKKVYVDGHIFDSTGESQRYLYLKDQEKKGKIFNLELQPKFELQGSFKKNGRTWRAMTYSADFRYRKVVGITWSVDLGRDDEENDTPPHFETEVVIEDFKGKETDVFKLKRKLFEKKYPHLTIRVVKKPGEEV